MKYIILVLFLMVGCSTPIVPKTANQVEVVTYSQMATLAIDANNAYQAGILSAEKHAIVFNKLEDVRILLQSADGMVESAKLLAEVVEMLK